VLRDRMVAVLTTCGVFVLLFITVVRADDPSELAIPEKIGVVQSGETGGIGIANWHLDRGSAGITSLEVVPVAPAMPQLNEFSPGCFLPPGKPVTASRGEAILRLIPAEEEDAMPEQGVSTGETHAAASTDLTLLNFESTPSFPGWARSSNSQAFWGRAECKALEGSYAAWPAREGSAGVDPCSNNPYPNGLDSWMVFGPFSLTSYRAAELVLFFRLESQADHDYLFWGASTNGTNFWGYVASGEHAGGPYGANGYNLATLDLAAVPTLGDLTGRSGLYVAIAFRSDGEGTDSGPFVDGIWLRANTDRRQYVTDESFDDPASTYPNWYVFDNNGSTAGEYWWGLVSCNAHSNGWALWPAAGGDDGRNPCTGASYPNNAQSWALYGPFSLSGASEAWVDFYFRNKSELRFDFFAWLASVDGSSFYGYGVSGDLENGPYRNRHNLARFYLDMVPILGDLRGRSQVWLAFIFKSNDSTVSGQGPFLDDVRIIVERPVSGKVYLPVVRRGPTVALTTLYVENQTSKLVREYRVSSGSSILARCTDIPAGRRVQCGAPFAPGTYRVSVNTEQCGSSSGQVTFPAGAVTRVVRCVRD